MDDRITDDRDAGDGFLPQVSARRGSRGRIVWEATFKKAGNREVEVTVDARTGKILAVKLDD